MITRNFDIVLRIPEQSHIPQLFQIVQNDVDVYILTVKITDGVNEIDYSEVSSATITFVKSDGNVVQGNMTVGADALTYTMGTNEIAYPGNVLASVQLIGSSNERLTTARFRFAVIPDLLSPSAIHSTTEFAELQRLKVELETIDVVELTTEVAAHMAEITSQQFLVTRDMSIVGAQQYVTSKRPKAIIIHAAVANTYKISCGTWGMSGERSASSIYTSDASIYNWSSDAVRIFDSLGNYTSGYVQNVSENGFEINWIKTGAGGTGTAGLAILVLYHGSDLV